MKFHIVKQISHCVSRFSYITTKHTQNLFLQTMKFHPKSLFDFKNVINENQKPKILSYHTFQCDKYLEKIEVNSNLYMNFHIQHIKSPCQHETHLLTKFHMTRSKNHMQHVIDSRKHIRYLFTIN